MPRGLLRNEQDEANLVFADNLHYDKVKIYEGSKLPLWVAQLGSIFSKEDPPTKNAITLRNRLYFSKIIDTGPTAVQPTKLIDTAWLIHELTHVWQYQHIGIRYLYDAIRVQIRLGTKSYDYGGEQGLRDAHKAGKTLLDFNPEQQGDIARVFYKRLKTKQDVTAWMPFIQVLKTLPM
jgi:hypothetical protein